MVEESRYWSFVAGNISIAVILSLTSEELSVLFVDPVMRIDCRHKRVLLDQLSSSSNNRSSRFPPCDHIRKRVIFSFFFQRPV